ncbi:hypothetical protein WJX75_003718 [Coccomyxa subellipsoidea]|uniref:3-oxo-5-alpha-steroid 4-dehydrogenase C-terminal domain-containing protein n=1 Tax=Coccomyxa subellipsoidea TaxID=248742 RepID=A0ABR2Z2K0_9CHLO
MALVLALITYVPAILMLYWVLATGAALFTLLLRDLGPAFSAAVLLSASRGKTWNDKPTAKLGPLTDMHVPQSWFAHFYMGARMHLIAYLFGMSYYIVLPMSILPSGTWKQLADLQATQEWNGLGNGNVWLRLIPGTLHYSAMPAVFLGVGVFVAGNVLQFQSHWILAKLRSQLSGQGKKEGDYSIPRGGTFELVSCPHYLGEIVIYAGLLIVLGCNNLLSYIIFIWVVANLLLAAGPTHKWYQVQFKQYPANRRALIPFLY